MADKSMGFNILFDANTRKAEDKIGSFAQSMQRRLERAIRALPSIQLDANSSKADRRIAEIQIELAALADKRIGIDIDASAAHAQVERLRSELVQLGSRHPNVQVRADTAAAAAQLAAVSGQARRLDGQNVNIAVNASDVARTISLLGLLTAGLAGVGAAVVPAAAALAALPALAGAAAQGVGAIAAGFSGVGDAVKALQDAETKAAAGGAQSASSRANSAQAIIAAQRGVEQATIQAHRAAITGAQQVADADKAVEAAEKDLARAQRDARTVQEDLTRARAEAKEEIEDLGRSLSGAALDEREAAIRLAEAKEELAAAQQKGVGGRELEKLQLNADKAALALENAKDRHQDLSAESERASKAGVEGSDRVVSAQKRAADAAERVTAAEGQLDQARIQAARTQQQALWAQQDAARQVEDAQRALTNAYTDAGTAGVSSVDKVAEAMRNLSPEARSFAHFLAAEILPGLRGIRAEIQASLLPRMETSLENLMELAPDVSAGLSETGRVIGDLSIKGSEMMRAGPWRADFRTIMAGNNRVLEDFGNAGIDVVDMWRNMSVSSLPMVERFSQFVERSAAMTAQFLESKRTTGELDAFFDRMSDTIAELVDVVADIVVGTFQLTQTMAPLGMVLLRTLADLAGFVGEIARANPEIANLVATLVVGTAAFNAIGKAVAGAALAAGVATGGWKTLAGVIGGLAPSAAAGSTAMQSANRAMDAAALGAGNLTERFTRSAEAGDKVAAAGGRISGVLTRVGSAIPVVGAAVIGLALAHEALTTDVDEAAEALLKGGAAAAKVRAQLLEAEAEAEQHSFGNWIGALSAALGLATPKLDDATAAMNRQRAAMDPLSRATSDAAQAQNDYLHAMERQDWAGAADAQRRFGDATAEVKRQQDLLKGGLESTTDALRRQVDQVIGAVEADIRYRDALDRATDSIRDHGASTDLNTDAGRRNQQALIDLARSARDEEQAMRDNGATVDQVRIKEEQHRAQLDQVARQMGFTRDQAQELTSKYLATPPRIDTNFFAHTAGATDAVHRFANDVSNIMATVRDEKVVVSFVGATPNDTGNILRAHGGAVFGPGTETSDGIPARLSNGEHVWTTREVRGAGGHGAVQRMRKMAAAGQLPGFAQGGPVSGAFAADYISAGLAQVKEVNEKFIKDNFPAGGSALGWARAQAGKPYIWAGVGPAGYDCSGFMSAITNVLRGKNPHSRVGATGNFPWAGFRPGVGGMFTIGSTPNAGGGIGHMAGTLAGVNVESRGSDGVVVGPRARGAMDGLFSTRASFAFDRGGMLGPGATGINLSGRPERVLSPDQTAAFERLVAALTTRVGASPLVLSGSGAGGAGGAGAPDWPSMIPVMRAAFAGALQQVFAAGLKTDVDYDALTLRLNRVAAINRRR